jgi:hypothetical protein
MLYCARRQNPTALKRCRGSISAFTMFSQWPIWLSRSPLIRRLAIRVLRVYWRIQRATLARAVIVLGRNDGRILVVPSPSGEFALPIKQLDAWEPVTTQVDLWLCHLRQANAKAFLVGIEGMPTERGITFLFAATTETPSYQTADQLWLEAETAIATLGDEDRGLLQIVRKSLAARPL